MTVVPPPLSDSWKHRLDFTHRVPPELFQSGDDVRDTPYVSAVRTSFEDLSLSAVFCVNRVPTVVFRQSRRYEPHEVRRIHAALWNQGLASIFVDLTEDTVRVFSLARVGHGSDDNRLKDSCLLEALSAASSTLEHLRGFISGAESGRLWHENPSYFRPQERIDAVLLNNLDAAHYLLQNRALPPDQAAAALIQTMFVAYLEDRQIIKPRYFVRATAGKYTSWNSLLGSGDVVAMKALFSDLNTDFNGDLFVAPCSFSDTGSDVLLTPDHLQVLQRFRMGREKMSRDGGGQRRFWGYDFRYIPVELISEVYDRFLRHKPNSKSAAGAYYTPMFLADTVVSSAWSLLTDAQKRSGQFLDPACGSGIFLVKSFQRLCQHWRENCPNASTVPWTILVELLNRLRGQDVNPTAVRISAFSLYLALLEQVRPPELRALFANGHRLPTLWNHTLRQADFFEDDTGSFSADVVIGNPPWSSRQGGQPTYVQWCRRRDYPVPSQEAAWAFTWKSLEHLRDGGLLAFLLPAMGFLHNQADTCIEARSRLFRNAQVRMVADLSDLRFQLFTGAVRPATLMVMSTPSDLFGKPYEFAYLSPKTDPNLRAKRFISITSQDRVRLRTVELSGNSRLFKERLWMYGPETGLFNYLSRLPRMARFIAPYTSNRSGTQWLIGVGFQPWHAGRSSGKPGMSAYVGEKAYLPVERFTRLRIDQSNLTPWASRQTRRRGFEAAFRGSRVLVRSGVSLGKGRLHAAFVTQPLTFQDIVMGITVPSGEEDTGKFVTAYLNSRLALWFAFHGTASLGADRPVINPMDLVQLPLPFPCDLADPDTARKARAKLIELVDVFASSPPEVLTAGTDLGRVLSEIDRLTYAYFDLNDDEISFVDETIEYILPAAHPSRRSFPAIWSHSSFADRSKYARALRRRLDGWFSDDREPAVQMIARNEDFAIVQLSLKPKSRTTSYQENDSTTFSDALEALTENLQVPTTGNFMLTPNVRVFSGPELYLIKPLQRRYWLLSAALADADAIIQDLDVRWQQGGRRNSAS